MKNCLEIKELVKSFGNNLAVNHVSFQVEKGRIFGLLGRNGAGKSTIFRIILNILKQDSGEVTYQGNPINYEISDKIGYLPEEGSLIVSYTVWEQFLYYGSLKNMSERKIKEQAFYWLKKFHILEYLDKKIKDLSKGNRQKIQFIIAVLHDPDLLILDEPFSGLDPISVEEFKQIIFELKKQGKMIVFSSHRMDHVEMLCDDILILNKGNTVLSGNLEQIKEQYQKHEVMITGKIGKYTMDIIRGTNGVNDLEILNDTTIKVKVANEGMIPQLFRLLKSSDITSFYTTKASLNEIFIDKVGETYEQES